MISPIIEKGMKKLKRGIPTGFAMVIGFGILILVGFLSLLLPVSQKEPTSALDCLFVATSAICVTGLTPVDISSSFTLFGQNMIMLMFQTGGLGFAVIVVFLLSAMSRTGLYSKTLLRESLGFSNSVTVKKIVKYTLLSTFIIEAIGASVLFSVFVKDFPVTEALHKAVFHSISAYNNAGFDLFTTSMTRYADNPVVMITVATLIALGGLGYFVYYDMLHYRRRRHLSLHSKIVLSTTFWLIVSGTVALRLTGGESWLVSFFHSVSTRTAGFFASDLSGIGNSTALVMIILMFIGASPGSTGGGIKTTTFYTIFFSATRAFRKSEATVFSRRISPDSERKAFALLSISICVTILALLLLTISEDEDFIKLFFEVISAFATVGLTMGVTGELTAFGKLVIILVMFIGRVGIISIITATHSRESLVTFPEEAISIG